MRSVDLAAGHGDEGVFDVAELAADQREQIGGLRPRIVPDREMPAAGQLALLGEIAVGEQHRRLGFVRLDARGVDRHHVGPVGEVGDAAEALGLALRAVVAARTIEPGELRVGLRIDQRLDLERERPVRRLRDGEAVRASRRSGRPRAARRRSSAKPASAPSPSSTSGAGAPAAGLGLSFSVARTGVCVGCSLTSRSTVSTSQSGGRYSERRTGRGSSVRIMLPMAHLRVG